MEISVAKKLESLIHLQDIDSKIDELKKIRGALPDEVQDLEDEIEKYNTRFEKQQNELEEFNTEIESCRNGIKNAEALVKKYEEQQLNVRNNREYDAIAKEVEYQQLEIQILEKKIKEHYENIELKKGELEETTLKKEEILQNLSDKKNELESITKESENDENKLLKSRTKATKSIEERLLLSYEKVRGNMRNGLAVVSVKRGACGGCFNIVPPQMQFEIREQKKIIVCEHCGRIMATVEDEIVNEEKPKRRKKTSTNKDS